LDVNRKADVEKKGERMKVIPGYLGKEGREQKRVRPQEKVPK
jgi:hypothetical protein